MTPLMLGTKMDDDKKDSEKPGNEIVDEEGRRASVQASQVAAANLVLDSDSSSNTGSSELYEADKAPKTEAMWEKRNSSVTKAVNMAGEERDKRSAARRTKRDAKNSDTPSKGASVSSDGSINSDTPTKGAWMGSDRRINSSSTKKEALKPAKLTVATADKKDGSGSLGIALSPLDEKKKDGKANWRDDDYALGVEEKAGPGAVRIGLSPNDEKKKDGKANWRDDDYGLGVEEKAGPGAVRIGVHRASDPSELESKQFSTKSSGAKHATVEDGEVVNAAIIDEEALQREFERKMRADMVQAAEVDFYEEPGFCQRNACKIGCASIVIIVGLAVGLGVGLSNSSGLEVVQNITNITNAPTMSPTLLGDYEYLEFLFRTISGDEVLDETTPQAQALESIYNESQSGVYNVRDLSEQYLDERYALRVLYYSTQGDGWGIADNNFTSTLPTCSWINATQGNRLVCNEKEEVTDLFLNSINLNGTIPSELGVLSSLSQLSLANNELYGKSVCTGTCAGSESIEFKPS
jgi:hypothetical protein